MRNTLSLVLAVTLLACGTAPSSNTPVDAGPPAPDPAYWGLADKACFHYLDGSPGAPELTLSIVTDTTTVGGVSTYLMFFRNQGLEQKKEWVAPTSKGLALYRRHLPPDSSSGTLVHDRYFSYAPPPDLLFQGLKAGGMDHVTSTTVSVNEAGMTSTQMTEFTLNLISSDPLHANGMDLTGDQYAVTEAVTGGSQSTTRLWFTPQVGLVQLTGFGSSGNWLLKSVEQNVLPEKCIPNP
jgi:hypothetical protein